MHMRASERVVWRNGDFIPEARRWCPKGGELLTPREKFVLPGASRATVIAEAGKLGIPCREADLDLYDAYDADEAFIT